MRREFAMPDVGEGLTEADILTWHVAPGDTVGVNQIIVEIETAKAAVELPSPYAGTIGELLAQPGETVAVGSPIIAIETAEVGSAAGSAASTAGATTATGAAAPATEERGAKIGEAGADGRIATLVGYGPRPGSVARRPRRHPDTPVPGSPAAEPVARPPVAPPPVAPPPVEFDTSTGSQDRTWTGVELAAVPGAAVPLAKPPVRKLARDLGVDLRAVKGTGGGGVITREDVEAIAAGGAQPVAVHPIAAADPSTAPPGAPHPAAATAPRGDGVRRVPIRGVRKATAAAMVSSAFTAPHVTEFLAVDVTAMTELRARLRASREFADIPLTPLAFVARAVCLAARRTPEINTHWDDAAGEIVYYERVQLGIAAATPRGLIVPTIRDADALSVKELAIALSELTATARAGRTAPADMGGGTFTITNVGVFGVDTGTPILNPGEAAILAVGAIKPAPWVVDGELAVRTVAQLALSFDHRLVDGEQGSHFLADVGALLTDPGLALAW